MTLRLSSPSFFQHLVWLPFRVFAYVCGSAKISGIEHVKAVKCNAIVASNHVTELDPLVIVACLPFLSNLLPLIYVVKNKGFYSSNWSGLRKVFYGGTIFQIIGGYEAYSGLNDYEKALTNHLKVIDKGLSVCIFPVSRIHTDGAYRQARGGVAYMAAKTGLPIIPVHIQGVNQQTTLRDYLRRKPKLTIAFGKPIYAKEIFKEPLNSITKSSHKECERAAVVLMKKIVGLG